MDISRLPAALFARPANTTFKANPPPRTSVEVLEPVEPLHHKRRTREVFDRVIQGELLQRDRDPAHTQTTQEFINERRFDFAQDSQHRSGSTHQARSAINLYLNNTRPEPAADLTQGRSVNFFV